MPEVRSEPSTIVFYKGKYVLQILLLLIASEVYIYLSEMLVD